MKWSEVDELQWCGQRDDASRTYDFVQVVWLDLARGDEGYPDKHFTVVTGTVCLDDYTYEDIETEICSYYDSVQQMCESYGVPSERWQELDDIVAECIFESWENFTSHGLYTKADAVKFAEEWMNKQALLSA